jgi:hypothetical protein
MRHIREEVHAPLMKLEFEQIVAAILRYLTVSISLGTSSYIDAKIGIHSFLAR